MPAGLEILDCEIVRLAGHPLRDGATSRDVGLGKLIDAVDVVIRPAADGIAYDAARLERICRRRFCAKADGRSIARGDKSIDVRALVTELDVIDGDAAAKLCAALDWPDAPALFRARVRSTSQGSAKPSEIARALGVWAPTICAAITRSSRGSASSWARMQA